MRNYYKILKQQEKNREMALHAAGAGKTEQAVQILLRLKTSTDIEYIMDIYMGRLVERKRGNPFNTEQIISNFNKLAPQFPKEIFSTIEKFIKLELITDEEITAFHRMIIKYKTLPEAQKCWDNLKKQ